MSFTVEDVSSVRKVLHIEVPAKQVSKSLEKAYQQVKKTAKIKGFRPGKAPRSVLERMYGKDVNADVCSQLIQDSLMEALRETSLNIVGSPRVDPPEIKPGEDYKYDATVDIRPEIEDIEFKGLELTRTLYEIDDEEIQTQLLMLQKNLAKREPIEEDRTAAAGDWVIIDYEGLKDGKPFDETKLTENFAAKLGSGNLMHGLEDQLVTMRASEEKAFAVTFPDDDTNEKLAGQTIDFKVNLKEIRKEVLPPLDDSLASQLGPFDTLDAVKDKIRENLEEGYNKRMDQEINEQVFQALIEKTTFELPESLVEMELEGILDEAERSFSSQGMSFEKLGMTREGLAEKYRETAEKQVRRFLLLGKIAEQEELKVDDEEMQDAFQEMAGAYGQPVEAVKAVYEQQPDKLNGFRHALLEKKAIRLIIDEGKITDVQPSADNKGDETQEDAARE